MNKLIYSFAIVCLSLKAYAGEPTVKISDLWLDRDYQAEVTFTPSKAELISSNSHYYGEEQDCDAFKPEHCSTGINFKLGTITIRIISKNGAILGQSTSTLTSRTFVDSEAVNHGCSPTAICNKTANAYLSDSVVVNFVNDSNQNIKAYFDFIDGNSIVTLDNAGKVVSSTDFQISHARVNASINDGSLFRNCEFLTKEEFAVRKKQQIEFENTNAADKE